MNPSAGRNLSLLIKEKAFDLGFDLCGIARSKSLIDYKPFIENWCSSGMNGEMNYLGREIEKRVDPEYLVPGAKSIIVTGLNYYSEKKQSGSNIPLISRYAYGLSYHDVLKSRLDVIIDYIKNINPGIEGRSFVDSAPILEKGWAREAGLGWPGKHSIIINNKIGSFIFLGIIVLDAELDYDEPFKKDLCGTCRICIDSCPTGAINENRTIDARKCISYLTIESKNPVPDEFASKLEGRVFGCDKCQEVCPWNKEAKPHNCHEFELSDELKEMTSSEWINLTQDKFKRLFKGSAIERRKYKRFINTVISISNIKIRN